MKIAMKTNKKAPKGIKPRTSAGIIYIGHLPHGFFEEELKEYFSQFGKVTNARVCRSWRTGKSKGYGFIQFRDAEVAEVAAETMNNYLLFKRRLVCQIVPENDEKNIFKGKDWTPQNYPLKSRRAREIRMKNANPDVKRYVTKSVGKLKEKMAKLKELGISHIVKPCNVPADQEPLTMDTTEAYCADPNDSDIEIKVPTMRVTRSSKRKNM